MYNVSVCILGTFSLSDRTDDTGSLQTRDRKVVHISAQDVIRFLSRKLVECHSSIVSCYSCNISTFGPGMETDGSDVT